MNVPDDMHSLSSVEAAELFLEAQEEEAKTFDMDGLTRAALRRAVGFDFETQIMPNVILFTSKEYPFVRTRIRYKELDEKTIERMGQATVKLRDKWHKEKARLDKLRKQS